MMNQNWNNQSWRDQKKKYPLRRNSSNLKTHKIKVGKPATINRERRKKSTLKSFFLSKGFIISVLVFGFACFVACVSYFFWVTRGLPQVEDLENRQIAESTKIYDRTGQIVLYEDYGDINRTGISLSEIPNDIKNATIAIEDKTFYEHGGISFWGIARSIIKRKGGGSTLTQQFIKNAILTPEQKITRKLKEWRLAYRMERELSKDEILELYLNEIPYGSSAYGVEAASQMYFGKSAKDTNLAEAAILAALPQAPSRYSPYGANKDILIGRQQYVLDLMVEQGYITKEKAEEAKTYELDFQKPTQEMKAPHFVMYVRQKLSEDFGFSERDIERGGYRIITTLDLYKQEIAEEVVSEKSAANMAYGASNAALVSIDPKNGQVLAMVGSKDYYSEEIDGQFNVVTGLRQPGSSIKPIVYASMFERGYTPDTILYDVVTNFSNTDKVYEPKNYDLSEHGPVSVRKALAGSLNVPAVKAMYLAGVDNVLDLVDKLGYSTLTERDRYGLSLVLGGGEVKLLEHTNAFSAFAREGVVHPTAVVLKIEDREGNIIFEFEEKEGDRVLDEEVSRMINSILTDNNARAYAFGFQNSLVLGSRPIGAKTGTTNDYRDAWTIGYTPSIVTGVWGGNNDNSPMNRGAGGSKVAAPIWNEYMKRVLGDTPVESFKDWSHKKTGKPILDGEAGKEEVVKIDIASGLLATEYTPAAFIEDRIYRQDHCLLYYIDKDEPLGAYPKDPSKDPQFNLWEGRVVAWAEKQAKATSTTITDTKPPTEYDNLHKPENQPTFTLLEPSNNQTVTEARIVAKINASAPRGINRAMYYINDNLISSNYAYPFDLEKDIDFLNNGYHNLKVRVCDDIDNCSEKSIEFNLILDEDIVGSTTSDISISWNYPSSGSALNSIDFPLGIKINNNNPKRIARIIIYSKSAEHEPYSVLTTIEPVDSMSAEGEWLKAPRAGTYKMYAEAVGWGGELRKSNEVFIIVSSSSEESNDSQ